jgi:hypothetical protein
VFETLNDIRNEIKDNFPYKVLHVPHAEADDIIGTITRLKHQEENILIVSGDHDFSQLQIYPGVNQYNPVKDEFLVSKNPARDLKEHILRGDRGDGIPNFLSPDDVFVSGGRQSPIREIKLDVWVTQKPEEFCDVEMLQRYNRNKNLVDLSLIPSDVESAIMKAWNDPIIGSKKKIYPYMVKHRMSTLLDYIHEF